MSVLDYLDSMRRHGEWADARLMEALLQVDSPVALRECAHIRGAQETWLARLSNRAPTVPTWPDITAAELLGLGAAVDAAWRLHFHSLEPHQLSEVIHYRTNAGEPFSTPLGEILSHMMVHGHYHRGKANAALAQAGAAVPIDYIVWQRLGKPQQPPMIQPPLDDVIT